MKHTVITVRRHNGQCAHGPNYSLRDRDVPQWVRESVLDDTAESDAKEGIVEQGGSKWHYEVLN